MGVRSLQAPRPHTQKGPTLGLMLYRRYITILDHLWAKGPRFHFVLDPESYVPGWRVQQ